MSMIWPQNPNPDGVSPNPNLTESEWVTQDVLSKASHGVRTILQLGFVAADSEQPRKVRKLIGLWGKRLRDSGAEPHLYAVIGVDDSNCSGFQSALMAAKRQAVTSAMKDSFPDVPLRGHVLSIARWASRGGFCRGLNPKFFKSFADETVILAYDYRSDGGTGASSFSRERCGIDAAPFTEMLIRDDLHAMQATFVGTALAKVPIIFVASAYQARTCSADPAQQQTLACRYADVWGKLGREPSIIAFAGFAWHDTCATFSWRGIEASPPLRAAAQWIAQNR